MSSSSSISRSGVSHRVFRPTIAGGSNEDTQADCVSVAFSREGVCRASDRHRNQTSPADSIGYRTGSSGASGRLIILIAAAFYYEKAADHRSAFVRWRPQVLQFWAGVNIYDKMIFPNPPIMPITLYPLMVLPTVTGAMCWFAIKVGLTTAALIMLFQIVRPPGTTFPPMFRSLVLLLSACGRSWAICITATTTC